MSTANFHQPEPFPLFAIGDEPFTVGTCPECGNASNYYGATCGACGSTAERVEPEFDTLIYEEWAADVRAELATFEDGLEFHRVELKPGYFAGTQAYVRELYGLDGTNDWDEEESAYVFGMSRDELMAAYHDEEARIAEWMRDTLPAFGFREYVVFARFNNGEVWYSLADDQEVA